MVLDRSEGVIVRPPTSRFTDLRSRPVFGA